MLYMIYGFEEMLKHNCSHRIYNIYNYQSKLNCMHKKYICYIPNLIIKLYKKNLSI